MSTPGLYTTEEERREAAELAGEESDEEAEAALREEAHHHRPTVYVPSVEGEAPRAHAGEQARASAVCTAVRCTTCVGPSDSCTHAQRGEGGEGKAHKTGEKSSHQKHHPRDADDARSPQAVSGRPSPSATPTRVRDGTMRS